MLKCAFVIACLVIASYSGVYASDASHCTSLEKAQKAAGKDSAVVALSPAQFHFLQGMYVASPTTPEGLPPGDGAVLLVHDKKDKDDKSDEIIVMWTRGPLVCSPLPIRQASKLMKMLAEVKAGATGDGDAL